MYTKKSIVNDYLAGTPVATSIPGLFKKMIGFQYFNGKGDATFRVASSLRAYQYFTIAVTVKGLICSG